MLLSLIIIVILNLFLGFFVFSKDSTSRINRSFLCVTIYIVIWAISNYLADISITTNNATFWTRTTFLSSTFLVWYLYIFSVHFPKNNIINRNKLIFLTIPLIVMIILSYSNIIVKVAIHLDWGAQVIFGNYPYLFTVYFISFIFSAIWNFINNYRVTRGINRSQLIYVIYGIGITALMSFLLSFIIPLLFNYQGLTKYSPYSTIIFICFTAYSILAHHLFDIRVIIKKTLVYSGLLFFTLGTYATIVFLLAQVFGGTTSLTVAGLLPNFVAALAIAIGFEPVRHWLSEFTDRWLFKGEYNSQEVLKELSEMLSGVIDLDEALVLMMKIITHAMRIDKSAAFVLRKSDLGSSESKSADLAEIKIEPHSEFEVKHVKTIGYSTEQGRLIALIQPVIDYFEVNKHLPIIVDELSDDTCRGEKECNNMQTSLKQLKAALVFPVMVKSELPVLANANGSDNLKSALKDKEHLIGLLVLGHKLSGDMFSQDDLNLLEIVVKQTAAAVEKARFYEEDQMKTEFVNIASHELLTPTAAMKGYLSMILDEGMGKVDKQARGYLEKVANSAQRLGDLVQDLLNVSRIEQGRIKIEPISMDLVDLTKQIIDELMPKVNEKNLKIEFIYPKKSDNMNVIADPERVHQILVNLIGNAIKYSNSGTIKGQIYKNQKQMVVDIADNGIGIKLEDQKHLFEKFYRASNTDQAINSSGTGLGLYISKKITELMGGKIWFESEVGKGSTFHMSLPAKK